MNMQEDPRSTLIKPSTIRLERLLPGPVERVWVYLVDSRKRATWLAAGEFDLRLGGDVSVLLANGVGGGWPTHVGILADQLNGVKPRPFWATHERLMKEFEATLQGA